MTVLGGGQTSAGLQAFPAGPPGKSAYDLAVENGFAGDVNSWLRSLQGANGVGEPGTPGAQGPPGVPLRPVQVTASGPLPYPITYVGVRNIPAGGIVLTLPPAIVEGTAMDLVLADETGLCSRTATVTINPSVGDTIAGLGGIILSSPYARVRLTSSSGSGLWLTDSGRTCQVAQMKIQLAADGFYDAVQAALTGGETDPASLTWTTGGSMSANGPLGSVIASVTGKTTAQMMSYVVTASTNSV